MNIKRAGDDYFIFDPYHVFDQWCNDNIVLVETESMFI